MADKVLVQEFLEKLRAVDSFKRESFIANCDNRGGKAEMALWNAMELSAIQDGRRWIPAGGAGYVIATPEKRVKRVRSRRSAATRILNRQADEIRRIDLSVLCQKDQEVVRRIEEQLASLTIRNRVSARDAAKKKPKGL